MFVYSQTILRFIDELKLAIQKIITTEVGLKSTQARFYNRKQTKSYPISLVVYNNKTMLGYFDPEFYELGFHERLMYSSKEELCNVIRHELAHYIAFINHGPTIGAHANEFKAICERFGWGHNVSNATFRLDAPEESAILRKVKKLMALSTSSHEHEAEQATLKSQQLLLKHNLEYIESDAKVFMRRVMKSKKETAKMRAIGTILKTFFVNIVYHRGDAFTHLEIVGDAVNVEIADYVASILSVEMDNLWAKVQISAELKGATAKNSFFLGIAKGYCDKVKALEKEHPQEVTKALLVIEKKLVEARDLAYPHLRTKRSSNAICLTSSKLGETMGKQLNINPAISRNSGKYLT